MIPLERIRTAEGVVRTRLPRTPLFESPALSARLGCRVFLKLESASPVSSFKGRGALVALTRWLESGPPAESEVVAASTGNFGLAVAWAARVLGRRATIYAPPDSPATKLAAIEREGGRLVRAGRDFDEAKDLGHRFAAESGGWWLEDGLDENVAVGAATIGAEIAEELPQLDAAIVPIGNGALIGGIGSALRQLAPSSAVYGVQPVDAAAMVLSFRERRPVPTATCATIADGLASRVPIPAAVDLMLEVVDDVVTVTEDELRQSVRILVEEAHVLVEPSSAAALAGAAALRERLAGRTAVLVLTGGNIDRAMLLECLRDS